MYKYISNKFYLQFVNVTATALKLKFSK